MGKDCIKYQRVRVSYGHEKHIVGKLVRYYAALVVILTSVFWVGSTGLFYFHENFLLALGLMNLRFVDCLVKMRLYSLVVKITFKTLLIKAIN